MANFGGQFGQSRGLIGPQMSSYGRAPQQQMQQPQMNAPPQMQPQMNQGGMNRPQPMMRPYGQLGQSHSPSRPFQPQGNTPYSPYNNPGIVPRQQGLGPRMMNGDGRYQPTMRMPDWNQATDQGGWGNNRQGPMGGSFLQRMMQQFPQTQQTPQPTDMVNNGWGKMIPRQQAEDFYRSGGMT